MAGKDYSPCWSHLNEGLDEDTNPNIPLGDVSFEHANYAVSVADSVSLTALDGQNSIHKGILSFTHKSHVGKRTIFKPPSSSKYIFMLELSGKKSRLW